jgi:hypothetical protein
MNRPRPSTSTRNDQVRIRESGDCGAHEGRGQFRLAIAVTSPIVQIAWPWRRHRLHYPRARQPELPATLFGRLGEVLLLASFASPASIIQNRMAIWALSRLREDLPNLSLPGWSNREYDRRPGLCQGGVFQSGMRNMTTDTLHRRPTVYSPDSSVVPPQLPDVPFRNKFVECKEHRKEQGDVLAALNRHLHTDFTVLAPKPDHLHYFKTRQSRFFSARCIRS